MLLSPNKEKMKPSFKDKMTSFLSNIATSPLTTMTSMDFNYAQTESSVKAASPLNTRRNVGRSELQSYEEILTKSRNQENKNQLIDRRFEYYRNKFNQNSKSTQKLKKKIFFLTGEYLNKTKPSSFLINNTLSFRGNSAASQNDNIKDDENNVIKTLKMNGKVDDSYMKTVSLFGNYKPIRRYYVSSLNQINGNLNGKSMYKKKNSLNPMSPEEKRKIKEKEDLQSYRMFSYNREPKKEEKKSTRYGIKDF